jgi:PPOX class probable F420-dependent enzyme
MLSDRERAFLLHQRIGRLATADRHGAPHVVPVGFTILHDTLYISIDEKPKHASGMRLKRVRNILENAATAFVADRYDEDWSRLGWVMLRGPAEMLEGGAEHDAAQAALIERYPQYATMQIAHHTVIALRIARVTSWGDLSIA